MAKLIMTIELDFGENKDFDYVRQTANAFLDCDYEWHDLIDEVGGYTIESVTIKNN